jgi:hypothetical protein
MSRWYKRAALSGNIQFVIETWLRNARNAFDSASTHDDITSQMEGADDIDALSFAVNSASQKVSAEQGGMLTPTQQELVNHLLSRNQSFNDPFNMPEVGNNQPMNNQDPMAVQPPSGEPSLG